MLLVKYGEQSNDDDFTPSSCLSVMSVIIAIVTLDRVGRRITLYWGAIVMGISLIIAGVGAR